MILMAHMAIEHVGDSFEAAMRVRREAADIVVRIIGIELIEHQERVHILAALAAQTAAQLDAGAVRSRDRLDDMNQRAGTHFRAPWKRLQRANVTPRAARSRPRLWRDLLPCSPG